MKRFELAQSLTDLSNIMYLTLLTYSKTFINYSAFTTYSSFLPPLPCLRFLPGGRACCANLDRPNCHSFSLDDLPQICGEEVSVEYGRVRGGIIMAACLCDCHSCIAVHGGDRRQEMPISTVTRVAGYVHSINIRSSCLE